MRTTVLAALALIACAARAGAADDAREADHVALRALLTEVAAALNAGDAAKLGAQLASPCSITFIDQRRITDVAGLQAYQEELRRTTGLQKATFAPAADELTVFLGPDAGTCTGTSTDTFSFADGQTTTMTSRWTATVVRRDGAWKVATVHAGVNPLDNPILERVVSGSTRFAAFAGALGLALGALIGIVVGRRRSA